MNTPTSSKHFTPKTKDKIINRMRAGQAHFDKIEQELGLVIINNNAEKLLSFKDDYDDSLTYDPTQKNERAIETSTEKPSQEEDQETKKNKNKTQTIESL